MIARASLDFETKSSYSLRVRVKDSGRLWVEKIFPIIVRDVNEAPTSITLSSSSIAENNEPESVIATLSASDPDSGSIFTYSLVPGSGPQTMLLFLFLVTHLKSDPQRILRQRTATVCEFRRWIRTD